MHTTAMKVFAHRGFRANAEENTIAAFKNAIELGVDGIELDVHLTTDDQWVVHHDNYLKNYRQKPISQLSLDEAHSLGNPDIPLLDGVLNLTDLPWLNIELKVHKLIADPIAYGRKLGEFLIAQNVLDRVNVSSFSYKGLLGVKSASKEIALSYLSVLPSRKIWKKYHRKLDLYSVNPHFLLVRSKHVTAVRDLGIQLHPWTVNSSRKIRKLLDMGVDAVITDVADLAMRICS